MFQKLKDMLIIKKSVYYKPNFHSVTKHYKNIPEFPYTKTTIKEASVINTYTVMQRKSMPFYRQNIIIKNILKTGLSQRSLVEQRGYIKRLLRLRYRWHFRPKLKNFKLFRKFFRRTFRRYRKIQKNKLFITKFRQNFSKLTGFNEKFIYKKWLRIRKNYNQYLITTNAVKRFSQSLLLSPYGFLVALKITPSLGASKFLIKSGSVSIDGVIVTMFSNMVPGSILQINMSFFPSLPELFSYQRWDRFNNVTNNFPFIYSDWSAMLFTLLRWPENYELIAPSFLSERWLRYYIHLFPIKKRFFKKAKFNTHVYKKIIAKKLI